MNQNDPKNEAIIFPLAKHIYSMSINETKFDLIFFLFVSLYDFGIKHVW